MINKPLPKTILTKMSPSELKNLAILEDTSAKMWDKMEKAQSDATVAMIKEDRTGHVGKPSAKVQRLINKSFEAEFFAFKAADTVKKFKESMRKKYT